MLRLLTLQVFFLTSCQCYNPFENPNLFEGDMVLSKQQLEELNLNGVDSAVPLAASKRRTWPLPVPYDMDPSIANFPKAVAVINQSIADYEQNTCIRFKRRTNETSFIYFYRGRGCSSRVGFGYGKRPISLSGWCWYKGAVIHEIAHALGFYHEQCRPDRDNYVRIHWENIPKNARGNFQKYSIRSIDSLGVPYDFDSIMHYASKAFNGRKVTIEPIDPNQKIGQRKKLSKLDILQLNLLYQCSGFTKPNRRTTAKPRTTKELSTRQIKSTRQPIPTTKHLTTTTPIKTIIVCENRARWFGCSNRSTRVHVSYAMYGRQSDNVCLLGPVKSNNCRAENSLQKIQSICNGKRYCKLEARDHVFGSNPCLETFKYLEVKISCIKN